MTQIRTPFAPHPKITTRDPVSIVGFSSAAVAGSAIGASITTALICALLWYFKGQRRVQGSHRDRETKETMRNSSRTFDMATSNEATKMDHCQSRQQSSPPFPSLAMSQHAPGETHDEIQAATHKEEQTLNTLHSGHHQVSVKCSGSGTSDAAPAELHYSKRMSMESEEMCKAARNIIEASSPATPSVYRFAPPESIQPLRQEPPNLTTEYSTASLGAYGELPHWVFFPADAQRDYC